MKSTQLLSVVLSLILVFGVTAGPAYAETDDDFDDDSINDDNFDDDRNEDDKGKDDDKGNKHHDLENRLEDFCEMSNDEKNEFFNEHPQIAQFKDRLAEFCELSGDKQEDAIENFIEEHIPEARDRDDYDRDDMLDRYCEMTDEQKNDFISMFAKSEDHVAKMNEYCGLDEDQRDAYIDRYKDEYKAYHDKNMRDMLERYCEMSRDEKRAFLAKYENAADHAEKMNRYCELDKDAKMKFVEEHRDEYKSDMKDKISDYKKEYKMRVDEMKEKRKDHVEKMKEKRELSLRLKEMIMDKRDISEEKIDEIKMKYKEKHGDLTDKKKSELKMKFKDHMSLNKVKMSDEHKSAIHERLAEMKIFKTELRERSSEMTDKEKQELRAEFIENAKDMQLAWISPRVQMNAGIAVSEIECREGFNLVMKASNGVPMCLKADSALRMIEKGIAVPAN